MYHIISPAAFNLVPWKNGLGSTTELAINEGGTIQHFDWRVSMSKVSNNGPFSAFTGYQRHLVLLAGAGIRLHYVNGDDAEPHASCDELTTPLACASFDGGLTSSGELIAGEIVDFNIITRQAALQSQVEILSQHGQLSSPKCEWVMAYAVKGDITISGLEDENDLTNKPQNGVVIVPEKHLFQIHRPLSELQFDAQQMILMLFTRVS